MSTLYVSEHQPGKTGLNLFDWTAVGLLFIEFFYFSAFASLI